MTYKICEEITSKGWNYGVTNAPAELVTKAKSMIDDEMPVVFGMILNTDKPKWVLLSVNKDNQLYVAARGVDS